MILSIADNAGMRNAEKIEKGHAPAHCDGPDKDEGEPLNFLENRRIDWV